MSSLVIAGDTSGTVTLQAPGIAGGTTITLPNTSSSMGFLNIPAVGSKTTSYTLTTMDVGKYVEVGTSGSIVIPTNTFTQGDAVTIYNNTTSTIAITCSATTTFISGINTVKTSMNLQKMRNMN